MNLPRRSHLHPRPRRPAPRPRAGQRPFGAAGWLRMTAAVLLLGETALRAADFSLEWDAVAAGGGVSSGGSFTVSDTLGQSVTATFDAATPAVVPGFWSWEDPWQIPVLTLSPLHQIAQTGDVAVFRVETAHPFALTYQWLFNGVPLVPGPWVQGATTHRLALGPAAPALAGSYQVRVQGGFGSLTSPSVRLEVNQPPVAGRFSFNAYRDEPRAFPSGKLAAAARDPDGDPLLLAAVDRFGAAGGEVRWEAGDVVYHPPAGYTGPDAFAYVLNDGRGGQATGTVTVTVSVRPPGHQVLRVEVAADGSRTLHGFGIPFSRYVIEASADLRQWDRLGTVTAAANGLFQFTDPDSPRPPFRYYRIQGL